VTVGEVRDNNDGSYEEVSGQEIRSSFSRYSIVVRNYKALNLFNKMHSD